MLTSNQIENMARRYVKIVDQHRNGIDIIAKRDTLTEQIRALTDDDQDAVITTARRILAGPRRNSTTSGSTIN